MDGVDTSNVTNMYAMFEDCSNLTSVPLFDTSNDTNMGNMFTNCSKLTSVPLFDTSNVTNMSSMFYDCDELTSIPALDMRNVTSAGSMFSSCAKLTEILVRNIKTNIEITNGNYGQPTPTPENRLHICKECRNIGSPLTLTIGGTWLLESTFVKLIEITDEMRAEDDLIDEKLPFVQCESTDEGAMTVLDYMALKNWSVK